MVNKLYFDIETLPAPESAEAMLRFLYDKKLAKAPHHESDKVPPTFEEFVDRTGLDGSLGRVLVIAYAIDDQPVKYLCNEEDEAKTISEFWDIAGTADMFIGHNVRDFDLPFIMQRSVILGVKPSWDKFDDPSQKKWDRKKFLDFARYRNHPIFDTMWEWSSWTDSRNNKSLEHVALALGLPTPKDGIDGSQVAEFFKKGKVKEICDYCVRDVETVRAVYKRMTFENLPNRETLPF